jgi:Flp pilus assembly protein TadG
MANRRKNQRGNAAVEATLTLTFFMTLLLSCYDIGYLMFFHQTLVHQATTGARYAAANPSSLTAAQNLVLYNQITVGNSGIMGMHPSNVSVTRTYGGSDDRVNVTISGFQYILLTPGWSGSYNGRIISVSLPVEN